MSKNQKKVKDTAKGPSAKASVKNLLPQERPSGIVFMAPAILFAAFTILIVRMYVYYRPMGQFFWTSQADDTQLTEFFSHDKAVFIIIMTCIAALFMIFRILYKDITIKKTIIYIPMIVYSAFVILSYLTSDYKDFALLGYNERFEGTIPLLCYMLMLFYIINTINTEKNVKQLMWPLAISTVCLSLLGLTQGLDKDFFRSEIGQKLIAPNLELSNGSTIWQEISEAFSRGEQFFEFTFTNKQIYQTVYNINYVSFYLTLLIPIFGMLFIRAWDKDSGEKLWKKIALGLIFALVIYNFLGSFSSGGFFGLAAIGILGIVILNKQLIKMWKPLLILFAIVVVVALPHRAYLSREFGGIFTKSQTATEEIAESSESASEAVDPKPASVRPWLDYLRTTENSVEVGMYDEGLSVAFSIGDFSINVSDAEGKSLQLIPQEDGSYAIDDDRFYQYVKVATTLDEEGTPYIVLIIDETDLFFPYDGTQVVYRNDYGNLVALTEDVPYNKFFDEHMGFGSGRGYIWSRSIPLLKDNIIVGDGADTYCISFPQGDYAGRFNWGGSTCMSIIVDKPHNMYLNVGIGTGCVSLIALLAVYAIYVFQSIKLYWKKDFKTDYLLFLGFGVFVGCTGFMVTGVVDDSTVSVMPMFYSLLGMGIAINMMLAAKYEGD